MQVDKFTRAGRQKGSLSLNNCGKWGSRLDLPLRRITYLLCVQSMRNEDGDRKQEAF